MENARRKKGLKTGGDRAPDLSVLALAQHELGKIAEAAITLQQAAQLLENMPSVATIL